MNNKTEYILCAAVMRKHPRECRPYFDNAICDIEIGYRHHDIIQRFGDEVDVEKQGFYTSKGRFVGREEAMRIAKEAGQCAKSKKRLLFSEDLY